MPPAIVCPFCNGEIAYVTPGTPPRCPRCDAPLPESLTSGITATPPSTPVESPAAPGRRATVLGILAVMAAMAAITVGYTLYTQSFRRENDFRKEFVAVPPTTQTPEELLTVGLLPSSCNVVAAVNVNDLRNNPVVKTAVFDDPPRSIAWLRAQLQSAAGIGVENIDEIALGIEIGDRPPKIFVIVQTRVPYAPADVVSRFPDARPQMLRGRPLVRFPLPHLGEGVAWCLNERHLAFLFRVEPGPVEDLEAISIRPRTKLAGSSATVQTLVNERVDKRSFAWLAADLVPASGLVDFLAIVGAKIEPYRPLLDAKALTLTFRADRDVVVLGQVLARSTKDLKALEESLRAVDWRGDVAVKIETPPPDADVEPWLTIQLRLTPTAVRQIFERGPAFRREEP